MMIVDFKPSCPGCMKKLDIKTLHEFQVHLESHKKFDRKVVYRMYDDLWQLQYLSYLVSKEFEYCCLEFREHVSMGNIIPTFSSGKTTGYWSARLQQKNVYYPIRFCPFCAAKVQGLEHKK